MRTRELIRIVCQSDEVEILAGHVGANHIHMLVFVSPHLSASWFNNIKGIIPRKLQMECKELNERSNRGCREIDSSLEQTTS